MVSFGVAPHTDTPTFGDARLPCGVRLHYAEQGPPTAPAVLMLHGYTDSWFSFSRVLPLMPPGLRYIVPDQRGHGHSDKPLSGYGMNDYAEDAIQLLDVLRREGSHRRRPFVRELRRPANGDVRAHARAPAGVGRCRPFRQ